MQTIIFRTDASIHIGTGHVMRCLTLADALKGRGAQCTFICRKHPGHLLDLISLQGHKVIALESAYSEFIGSIELPHAFWLGTDWVTDAAETRQALGGLKVDWIVVDHYSLDRRWEEVFRSQGNKVMVIDDLADRPHDCDLLLDQNLGRTENDYSNLLALNTLTLIGPKYALLRHEFVEWRDFSLDRRQKLEFKTLFIAMGGVDQHNVTGKILELLKSCGLSNHLHIIVVLGHNAQWLTDVQRIAKSMPWSMEVLVGVSNIAQLMAGSDLAIGAAGSTSWERCCLGLPAIQIPLALNQKEINDALVKAGAAVTLDIANLKTELAELLVQKGRGDVLRTMSLAASNICDGNGANEVVTLMMK